MLKIDLPQPCQVCDASLLAGTADPQEQLILSEDLLFICPACQAYHHRTCWKNSASILSKAANSCKVCGHEVVPKAADQAAFVSQAALLKGLLSVTVSGALLLGVTVPVLAKFAPETYAGLLKTYAPALSRPTPAPSEPPAAPANQAGLTLTPGSEQNSANVEQLQAASAKVGGQDTDSEALSRAIRNWQTVKKRAFETLDTSELATVLTGKALEDSTGGVSWWRNNTATSTFYSIDLHSLEVLSAKVQGDTATVDVRIHESRNDSVNGRRTSQYKATYTLVRNGQDWLIQDMQAD